MCLVDGGTGTGDSAMVAKVLFWWCVVFALLRGAGEAVNEYGRREITLSRLPSRCYANTTRAKTTPHQCDSRAMTDGMQANACTYSTVCHLRVQG